MHKDLLIFMLFLIFGLLLIVRHINIKREKNKPDCYGDIYGPSDDAERDCWTCEYYHECHRAPDERWDSE